jgi:hypothetical protein
LKNFSNLDRKGRGEIFALLLLCGGGVFCGVAQGVRHGKLLPLTQPLTEVMQELELASHFNGAATFDLKTTNGKKSETVEGKFFTRQNGTETNVRITFDGQSFLVSGKTGDKIFCSKNAPKIGRDDPIQAGHLLTFSDILMPFLHGGTYECRGERRVLGRNTHIIRCKDASGRAIDIAYDPKIKTILQVEHFDGGGKLVRTLKLLNFKKTQGVWLVKSMEIRDVVSGATSQMTLKRVVLEQLLPADIFSENSLETPPAEGSLKFIDF